MAVMRRPKSSKSPAILSHEFVIQNHADIVSCGALLVAIGLMFQATSPIASLFITLQHNITIEDTGDVPSGTWYTYGLKDVFTVFFYTLICVIFHAVVQEYIFDKLNRRMHLSKVKHAKFNESGHLVVFYAVSAIWGLDLIIRENYAHNISSLWESYPHVYLPSMVKFFYIAQLAYWFHSYPELYFQKLKKDEVWAQIQYITIYIVFISVAYVLNMTRLALVLLVLHYTVEFIFHASRLLYFSEKTDISNSGFMLWNVLFVFVRLSTITLSVLTLWYGMSQTSRNSISFVEGNFNTQIVRVNSLVAVFLLQAWVMWNFITFHLRRMRELSEASAAASAVASAIASRRLASSPKASIKKRKTKGGRSDDGSEEGSGVDEPLVENGTTTSLRQRNAKTR